jgi:hypothetical protein
VSSENEAVEALSQERYQPKAEAARSDAGPRPLWVVVVLSILAPVFFVLYVLFACVVDADA